MDKNRKEKQMTISDNEGTVEAYKNSAGFGKVIKDLKLVPHKTLNSEPGYHEDSLVFHFTDGTGIRVFDDSQDCCEHRYMTTDDKLVDFIGSKLMEMEIAEAPTVEDKNGDQHEIQFLKVKTSAGVFTLETHNEHNGYYGGFRIKISRIDEDDS